MIYKINGSDVYSVTSNGAQFIIFSTDGEFALVKSNETIEESLEIYADENLNSLLHDPLFRQPHPCEDC